MIARNQQNTPAKAGKTCQVQQDAPPVSRTITLALRSDCKFGVSSKTLTPAQAARVIGCSGDTIRARCRLGEIRTVPGFTRPYRIPLSEIDRLLGG